MYNFVALARIVNTRHLMVVSCFVFIEESRAEIYTAAGIAAASIVVFIVAIILVFVCCRRMSYRLNLKRFVITSKKLFSF